jgi:hypothetical protein
VHAVNANQQHVLDILFPAKLSWFWPHALPATIAPVNEAIAAVAAHRLHFIDHLP